MIAAVGPFELAEELAAISRDVLRIRPWPRPLRVSTASIGQVHALLSHPVYGGRIRSNKSQARTGRRKSASEQVFADVPAIIDPAVFAQVQSLLKARSPKVTPPRTVSGPILLTGLAVCATCDGGMTLRTGTSKTGKVHRYYTCSASFRSGKIACKGRLILMDKLNDLVTEHLVDRLLNPERLIANSVDVDSSVIGARSSAPGVRHSWSVGCGAPGALLCAPTLRKSDLLQDNGSRSMQVGNSCRHWQAAALPRPPTSTTASPFWQAKSTTPMSGCAASTN